MYQFIDFPMLGRTSLITLWIPKILAQISVFVAGLCRSMQSSVATYSLSSFLNSVSKKFWCSSLVLVATGIYCVVTPNLFATSFSWPSAFGVCRDIIFVAPLSGPTRLVDPNRFRDACLILLIYLVFFQKCRNIVLFMRLQLS